MADQTFIPDGFVLLPAAVDRVALKKNVPREEAEQMLRQLLFRREIDYVFQAEETGVHFTMGNRRASANAANWFDDGRVFLHRVNMSGYHLVRLFLVRRMTLISQIACRANGP